MKNLFKTNIIIGLFTILPIVILIIIFQYVYQLVKDFTFPLTTALKINLIVGDYLSAFIGLVIFLILLFIIGSIVKTRIGKYVFTRIEYHVLGKLPLYKPIKDTLEKFNGGKGKAPVFSRVGLVDPYKTGSYMTAFVTDETEDRYTVFMPTSPQPTTGYIFHVKKEDFILTPEVKFEEALKTIISVGVGSDAILKSIVKRNNPEIS
ncbi:MAG: DUF502 domain-containing protein [Fusobacteria bacterium]|nr:DUF502 domain-containing protein [Fusobacteriota bacterium]